MDADYIWHLWPARHWPALPEEEAAFVDALQDRAIAGPQRPERLRPGLRADITALVNALRTGMSASALLEFLPGTSPDELLAAYTHLEQLRAASTHAWAAIVATPTAATLRTHSGRASLLLPAAMRRLYLKLELAGEASLPAAVTAIVADIEELHRIGADIEDLLRSRTGASAVSLGVRLHNPHDPALWGADLFLPERVGALSPIRIGDLLGERA